MGPELSLLVVRVADLAASRQFYERLGLTFRTEQHGSGPEHLSAVIGGLVMELYPRANSLSTEGLRLGFVVPELAMVAGTCASSVVEDRERDGQRVVVLRDPDGHKVELTQRPA